MSVDVIQWHISVDRSMIVVNIQNDTEHPVTGFFASVDTLKYPELLESVSLMKNCGYHYAAVHFLSIPEWDLELKEGEMQVVDYYGKVKIPKSLFFEMCAAFGKKALEEEALTRSLGGVELPSDWRPRIEATLPNLKALAKAEIA